MLIEEFVRKHENYRRNVLNMIPSENLMPKNAREILSSDLTHRYYSPELFYRGNRYIDEIVDYTRKIANELFGSIYSFVEPLSGTIAVIASILAYTEHGDKVMIISQEDGGFPIDVSRFGRRPIYHPFDSYNMNIDVDRSVKTIREEEPKLVFLGSSLILFPHPTKEISDACKEVGSKVVYDASHVLGLIAGGAFQDPFNEGVDVIVGSTHKTFPGPQGGIILLKNYEDMMGYKEVLSIPIVLVDNPHLNRIAALGATIEYMLKEGRRYANQVILNSKRLAEILHEYGVKVACEHLGFTESHQVYLPVKEEDGMKISKMLEDAGIIVDCMIRMGTQELTMMGMKEEDMEFVAEKISQVLKGEDRRKVREEVRTFIERYSKGLE
ncbi:MAG: serine hydroxymethyltransferase [Candidatus Asgardarchaeia archaeon]